MNPRHHLWFGPLAAGLLAVGIPGLALLVPGYAHVQQTVSEIGEAGSPARVPFAVLLCAVAACILVFAHALYRLAMALRRSRVPAYLTAAMGVSVVGVGLFAHPHPLHNLFGMSELIGYQAPLVLALTWRRHPDTRGLVMLSWVFYLLVMLAVALNLSSLDRQGVVWSYVAPRYGVAQRLLFFAWFGWCALVGLFLSRGSLHRAYRS